MEDSRRNTPVSIRTTYDVRDRVSSIANKKGVDRSTIYRQAIEKGLKMLEISEGVNQSYYF